MCQPFAQHFYQMRAISIFSVLVSTVAGMGAMGLGLAIVGLHGLVSYAAVRRTREIERFAFRCSVAMRSIQLTVSTGARE